MIGGTVGGLETIAKVDEEAIGMIGSLGIVMRGQGISSGLMEWACPT